MWVGSRGQVVEPQVSPVERGDTGGHVSDGEERDEDRRCTKGCEHLGRIAVVLGPDLPDLRLVPPHVQGDAEFSLASLLLAISGLAR